MRFRLSAIYAAEREDVALGYFLQKSIPPELRLQPSDRYFARFAFKEPDVERPVAAQYGPLLRTQQVGFGDVSVNSP